MLRHALAALLPYWTVNQEWRETFSLRFSGTACAALLRGTAEVAACLATPAGTCWLHQLVVVMHLIITLRAGAGVRLVCEQLATERFRKLHVVWGMCADKDVPGILRLLPADAVYYFTQASVKRALPAQELMTQGVSVGLQGSCYADVPAAVQAALDVAAADDLVFIGGSSFVVADWLAAREKK